MPRGAASSTSQLSPSGVIYCSFGLSRGFPFVAAAVSLLCACFIFAPRLSGRRALAPEEWREHLRLVRRPVAARKQ